MTAPDTTDESAFDLRARAELTLAFDPGPHGEPPAHLLRHTPWHARSGVRRLIAALLVGSSAATAVFAMRPPELVRAAIEHEYYERTLRGSFMPEAEVARRLDLPAGEKLPGPTVSLRCTEPDGAQGYRWQIARDAGLLEPGYRVLYNVGMHGGQEIPHLHAHIFGGRPLGRMIG